MSRFKYLVASVIAIIVSVQLYAGNAYAEVVEISAEGSYVVGDGEEENFSLAKDRARLEAKRVASEQAGVYVEAYSEVNHMQLTKDEIHTLTANVLKIKSEEFTITTREDKYIVFTCKIVADVDTDNINMEQRLKVDALKSEIAMLRQEVETLQRAVSITSTKETENKKPNASLQYLQMPKNSTYVAPIFENHGNETVIKVFPSITATSQPKPTDLVKKPKGFKPPSPKAEMFSTKLVPNPDKWAFMFFSYNTPNRQPVWYDPNSIKIIKNEGKLIVVCDIMSYYFFYEMWERVTRNIYQTYTVMVNYTDKYYVLTNKNFIDGEYGENISPGRKSGVNYNDVNVQIPFGEGKKKKPSFPEYLAEICAGALN